jgi:hypothetical protein
MDSLFHREFRVKPCDKGYMLVAEGRVTAHRPEPARVFCFSSIDDVMTFLARQSQLHGMPERPTLEASNGNAEEARNVLTAV